MRRLNQQQQIVYAAMMLDTNLFDPKMFPHNNGVAEAMTVGATLKEMFATGKLSNMYLNETGAVVCV